MTDEDVLLILMDGFEMLPVEQWQVTLGSFYWEAAVHVFDAVGEEIYDLIDQHESPPEGIA